MSRQIYGALAFLGAFLLISFSLIAWFFSYQEKVAKDLSKLRPINSLESPYKEMVAEFLEEARKRELNYNIENLMVEFIEPDPWGLLMFSGICSKSSYLNFIKIVKVENPVKLKNTFFHELGHCALGLHHYFDYADRHKVMYFLDSDEKPLVTSADWDEFLLHSPTTPVNPSDEFWLSLWGQTQFASHWFWDLLSLKNYSESNK